MRVVRIALRLAFVGAVFFYGGNNGDLARGQAPTTEVRRTPNISLTPVALVNLGLDGIARPFGSPSGIGLNPEFLIPRNTSKTIEVSTSGGGSDVSFMEEK